MGALDTAVERAAGRPADSRERSNLRPMTLVGLDWRPGRSTRLALAGRTTYYRIVPHSDIVAFA
jgi:hypothetical protein